METAQVQAGVVAYPHETPFYVYHVKLWTLLHQVCALLLLSGVSEIARSRMLSGVMGMLSFQALEMFGYAFSSLRARPPGIRLRDGRRSAGIAGNQRSPAALMRDNLDVAAHIVPAAWRFGVRKLLYLASSSVYPKHAPQPLRPESLWSGPLEPTSAAYAVAKLA